MGDQLQASFVLPGLVNQHRQSHGQNAANWRQAGEGGSESGISDVRFLSVNSRRRKSSETGDFVGDEYE